MFVVGCLVVMAASLFDNCPTLHKAEASPPTPGRVDRERPRANVSYLHASRKSGFGPEILALQHT